MAIIDPRVLAKRTFRNFMGLEAGADGVVEGRI